MRPTDLLSHFPRLLAAALFISPVSAANEEEGFRPLFNGKDLSGWVPVNTAPSTWSFEDGMLICSGKPIGELRTDRMYQNFILELEWRHMVPKGNAGVFIWADDITARGQPFHRGIEVQILENAYGDTKSHTTHGDIFPIHGATMTPTNGRGGSRSFPSESRSKPSPEWNHYRIECVDGAITLSVNGKVVNRGEDCSPRKGYICIESEGGIVHYRNVRIKELPDSPIEAKDVAIADRGYRCHYTGVDLSGWKTGEKEGAFWKPKDWVLSFTGPGSKFGSWIATEEEFDDFGFIIDIRLPKDKPAGGRVFLRGSEDAAVNVRQDDALIGPLLEPPGKWNRFEGTFEGNRLSLTVNGQEAFVDREIAGAPAGGPLAILPDGPMDVANIYTKTSASQPDKNSTATKADGGGASRPPNVILIMTDDQGYGDFACHGNTEIRTPHLDRLHSESVRFTDFHVDPTCAPTRAALMTGRYSARAGVWLTNMGRHRLRADEVTMADVFSDNGYRTGIFGKWHLGDNYPFRPNDRGFQESLIHGGGVVGEAPDYWGNDYYDDTYVRNGTHEEVGGYCTDVWFEEATKFIEESGDPSAGSGQAKPFFVYLPTNAAHGPHNVPIDYVKPYLDAGVPESRARFYGMIANIDENVGRLRARLKELELEEDTILIFMTDNGTASGVTLEGGKHGWEKSGFNAGMRGRKGSPYEGGHRAACFLRWPNGGLDGGRDVPRLTAHIDLLPTLIELCKLEWPKGVAFDGWSLAPFIGKDTKAMWPQRALVVHHQGRFGETVTDDRPIKYKDYAVMTDRFRLVGDGLYDIESDPGQKRDISGRALGYFVDMKNIYGKWWLDISTRFDEYSRTVVGSTHQEETVLTCQEWHGEHAPYNQQHVRTAMEANGFWDIDVARAGEYEITLRRWPVELDLPIRAAFPRPEPDPAKVDAKSKMIDLPSRSIEALSARLKVGPFDETSKVSATDKAITFRVKMDEGEADLRTWFTDAAGKEWGAYYVYVKRVEE